MPNTSALHEHPLSLMVPMPLMPALLFDIRFADSNTHSLSLCCSKSGFNAIFLAIH